MKFVIGAQYITRDGELWENIKLPTVSLPTFRNEEGKIIVQSPDGKYRWDYDVKDKSTHHGRDFV